MADVQNELNERITRALDMTKQEVHAKIYDCLNRYYNEYEPKSYKRTYAFADKNRSGGPRSLDTSKAASYSDRASVLIGFADKYLDYVYNREDNITGRDVVSWADEGYHGGNVYSSEYGHVWSDAMEAVGGNVGLIKMFKENLLKCGVPVK